MVDCRQHGFPDLGKKRSDFRISGEAGSEDYRLRKVYYDLRELWPAASQHWLADRYFFLVSVPVKQHFESSKDEGVESRAFAIGQLLELAGELHAQVEGVCFSPVGLSRGPRTIGR